jgi:predicted transcriptional regulator
MKDVTHCIRCNSSYEAMLKQCPKCGTPNYQYHRFSSSNNYYLESENEVDKILKALDNANRRRILKFLIHQGKKSRREIADELNVSLEAAVKHCDQLIDIGVISETGESNSERGGGYITKYYIVKEQLREVLRKIAKFLIPEQPEVIEVQQSVNRTLDKARDNIRKATDEAIKDIPHYTNIVKECQEQSLQAAGEITDNYIESQREIINSIQGAWKPYLGNTNGIYYYYPWFSPQRMADVYSTMASSFTDYMTSAARIGFNNVIANMEASKISMRQARDNAKLLSKIGINPAKAFGGILPGTILPEEGTIVSPTIVNVIPKAATDTNLSSEMTEILELATNT